MQGMKPDEPNEKSPDPVERTSARVQAVACLFPPTDFLNYGEPGKIAWTKTLNWLPAPFDFQKLEPAVKGNPFSLHFVKVNAEEQKAIAKEMSPIYWVTKDAPPTLIIHGDADNLVPLEQSQRMIEKLDAGESAGQAGGSKGEGPRLAEFGADVAMMLDWFNQHLAIKKSEPAARGNRTDCGPHMAARREDWWSRDGDLRSGECGVGRPRAQVGPTHIFVVYAFVS